MFNRRELLLLRAMYRHDTVTAAAASVNMTQPAASALLRDMETRLGFALFSRENRRLHLTSQGRALIPEVLNALAGIEAVDRLAVDIRQGALARLDVGAVAIAASSLLPPALAGMRQAHPLVAVTVRAGIALEIIEMAVDHRIDLGIIIGAPSDIDRVSSLRLAPLGLHAVMARDHPWAQQPALTLEQVADAGPIVLAPALPAGRATRQALEARGLPYRPIIEVAQSSAACALAAQGLGVAIVESLGAHYAERQGLVARHLLPLEDPVLAVVWSKDRAMSAPAQLLQQGLAEQASACLQQSTTPRARAR
ncbi:MULTISPECIES: LysR family transcriptional regulator [Achromobacter]|uniref:LysR family transcriptional regulator n=1 Tax=Achromobacter spanius TaxID=217203 RepID=A0ABY8GW86_9BURK|nr:MULTISPECIES: LysR family transcriptional regulator [Achromobacter]WAI81715.1 LysR family transcriptional regulator [Achromobacter spanius]WEX97232.1 LysR family transcriptional regulator [Achromobacter sp. SS2-2022]WFP09051.1 LysR family transcriptional regulator [Achromobacter spanius]